MKRLVICCDGTWNSADQQVEGLPSPTNVVRFAFRVAKRDENGIAQIVYYDQGVGTGNAFDRLAGGALGEGLEANIHDAYRFLIANYEVGDEIFVLGFSRGAYTARSIIGMVRKCGILHQKHSRHYLDATALYCDATQPTDAGPTRFRENYCLYGNASIDVQFVGVWDTVGSLGIPLRGLNRITRRKYEFHDTELSGVVKYAFHALAVDEYRAPFEPAIWEYRPKPGQVVEQVWFAGAHSDVGGGYARKARKDGGGTVIGFEPQLADIALDWMIARAKVAGLRFDAPTLAANPLEFDPLAEIHDSRTGFYNLSPKHVRDIGVARIDGAKTATADATQSLHPSLLARWDADASYRPPALKQYFQRVGDPRAAR